MNSAVAVWPVWEIQGHGSGAPVAADSGPLAGDADVLPPWFSVRISFADGARVDVIAAVSDGRICVEDLHADPPLPLEGFAALAEWIAEPLQDACRAAFAPHHVGSPVPRFPRQFGAVPGPRRAMPRHRVRRDRQPGRPGRRTVAEAYLTAQEEGTDPVLAVMCATGRSRRRSLRLIASARDAGFLTPRHNRR